MTVERDVPRIEVKSTNWLFVDRQLLTIETTTPEELHRILTLSREVLTASLDETTLKNAKSALDLGNDTIEKLNTRPWVHTIRLGARETEDTVLSSIGASTTRTVYYYADALAPELRGYWEAVEAVDGLYPRANSHMTGWDDVHDGTWLDIRDQPPVDNELVFDRKN